MAPYSLSACQVVRVFCAVMRALGASPIMSLGICARPPPPLRFARCAPRCFLKIFLKFRQAQQSPATHKTTMASRHVPCA
eukprot:scaffold8805_cov91-Skeletonema_dohrnii-CCMP3373.AAC.2